MKNNVVIDFGKAPDRVVRLVVGSAVRKGETLLQERPLAYSGPSVRGKFHPVAEKERCARYREYWSKHKEEGRHADILLAEWTKIDHKVTRAEVERSTLVNRQLLNVTPTGIGCYPLASHARRVSDAATVTCTCFFQDSELTLVALRPMEKGAEVVLDLRLFENPPDSTYQWLSQGPPPSWHYEEDARLEYLQAWRTRWIDFTLRAQRGGVTDDQFLQELFFGVCELGTERLLIQFVLEDMQQFLPEDAWISKAWLGTKIEIKEPLLARFDRLCEQKGSISTDHKQQSQ